MVSWFFPFGGVPRRDPFGSNAAASLADFRRPRGRSLLADYFAEMDARAVPGVGVPAGSLLPGDPAHPGAVAKIRAPAGSLLPGDPLHEGAVPDAWTTPYNYGQRPPANRGNKPIDGELADVPAWMQGYFDGKDQLQNWRDFNLGIDRMGNAGPNLRRAFREINAAEGGGVPDSSDSKGPAVAGITLNTLGRYPTPGTGPKPTDVKPWQWPAVYGAYFDRELADAHGRETLDKIHHSGVATFVADTVFRNGDKGVEMIQEAINDLRLANGEARIKKDRKFGPETLDALNQIVSVSEDRQIFAERLRIYRDNKHGDESRRNRHFYELAVEGD